MSVTVKTLKKKSKADKKLEAESKLFLLHIPFLKKNFGAHLIVLPESWRRIDFWPGTGLWISHFGSHRGTGINSMLEFMKNREGAA